VRNSKGVSKSNALRTVIVLRKETGDNSPLVGTRKKIGAQGRGRKSAKV